MKLLPQMVDEIKIRFAEDIGTSVNKNRITSNKANIPNEASLATNERCNKLSALFFHRINYS